MSQEPNQVEEENRWAIWIDIEGFGNLYKSKRWRNRAINVLGELLYVTQQIGEKVFRDNHDRLFVDSHGDGLFIASDGKRAARPVAISVAVLQCLLQKGGLARAAIAKGGREDIVGCLPPSIQDAYYAANGGYFSIGNGLMNITTVAGSALINAYNLAKKGEPLGPTILLDGSFRDDIPPSAARVEESNHFEVDWVYAEDRRANTILETIGRLPLGPNQITVLLEGYLSSKPPMDEGYDLRVKRLIENHAQS